MMTTKKQNGHGKDEGLTGPVHGRSDPLRSSWQAGQLVFCEEVARDGAQAKTLLLGPQRIEIARRHSALLGSKAEGKLVFAAGFPAIAKEEFEIIRQLADEVDCCQLMVVCRATADDIDEAIRSLRGARWGRLFVLAPMSEATARVMLRATPAEAVGTVQEMVQYARETAPELQVDIALVDAPRADFSLVAAAASQFHAAGAEAMVMCDTVGSCTPLQAGRMARKVVAGCDPDVLLGIHIHNDLGFGLASTFEAMRAGVRYVATSWLGLAERSGMAATEQLLVALGSAPDQLEARYGLDKDVWQPPGPLTDLVPLATDIASWVNLPLKVTDPVVGSGVNSISTGTPFQNPIDFVPYDAKAVLGVEPRIFVTQLASRRVLREVASQHGIVLNREQLARATAMVKARCYARGQAVLLEVEVKELLTDVTREGETRPGADSGGDEVPISELPISQALPPEVMAAAAAHLPAALARTDGDQVLLSPMAAAAYNRVVQTDFSRTAWHMDNPHDRETVALWAALGGSFIADFADDPSLARIFAWILSPCPAGAQHSLLSLKGRDGYEVPTSILTTPAHLDSWIDRQQSPVTRQQLDALVSLGPVGIRVGVETGKIPAFYVQKQALGPVTQAVFPGNSPHWTALLETLQTRTGRTFFGATSANISSHSTLAGAGAAHNDLTALQAHMGHMGIPLLAGPIVQNGISLPPEARHEGYKTLNRQFLTMDPELLEHSEHLIPTSLSLLQPRAVEGHWLLRRHGSLHLTVLRRELIKAGVFIQSNSDRRLVPARYDAAPYSPPVVVAASVGTSRS